MHGACLTGAIRNCGLVPSFSLFPPSGGRQHVIARIWVNAHIQVLYGYGKASFQTFRNGRFPNPIGSNQCDSNHKS